MSASEQLETSDIRRKMQRDWDERAQENAFYYVASSRRDWTDEEFLASGRESVRSFVVEDLEVIAGGRDPKKMRVLEIGCGAGRMTRALADVFGEVHGLDVSSEMVARARRLLADAPNAYAHHGNGVDLSVLGDLRFDFAFSFIVFQHIPSAAVIESYVRDVGSKLKPGGIFKFQVQGWTQDRGSSDDTWFGYGFSETAAREMVERQGFDLIRAQGAGGQYFWLWARKPSRLRQWQRAAAMPGWLESLR